MSLSNLKFGAMLSQDQMKGIKGGDDCSIVCVSTDPDIISQVIPDQGCSTNSNFQNMAACLLIGGGFINAFCTCGPPP